MWQQRIVVRWMRLKPAWSGARRERRCRCIMMLCCCTCWKSPDREADDRPPYARIGELFSQVRPPHHANEDRLFFAQRCPQQCHWILRLYDMAWHR